MLCALTLVAAVCAPCSLGIVYSLAPPQAARKMRRRLHAWLDSLPGCCHDVCAASSAT
jgi:hypothetical protein